MRLFIKLLTKLFLMLAMVALMAGGLKYGRRYILQATGTPEVEGAQFSSDESDLMSTIFQSALRLVSGTASRNELAGELSDKLYSGRMEQSEMSEIGIELVKPEAKSSGPGGGAGFGNSQRGANSPAKQVARGDGTRAERPSINGGSGRMFEPRAPAAANAERPESNLPPPLARIWEQVKPFSMELALVPVALLMLIVVHRIRSRSRKDSFVPPSIAIQAQADTETYYMKHAVKPLKAEEFELLVALIYQRQGYRVSLPAGLGGGRGGDFVLARKSERVVVQCKKLNMENRVDVERVRELHEAVTTAGATRGLYVVPCGFTWDARNFAKANRITLINGRTLDELITQARETPDEDILAVSQWAPKLMSKVELTTPHCPSCEAKMDELKVSATSGWVCSQRPECRGRRSARKYQKLQPRAECKTEAHAVLN